MRGALGLRHEGRSPRVRSSQIECGGLALWCPAPLKPMLKGKLAHDGLGPDDRDDLEDRRKPTTELDEE